jgi:general secretion pathway protein F
MRSGVPLPRAWQSAMGGAVRAQQAAGILASGEGVGAALRAAGFPPSDAASAEAGEATGRLAEVFASLERHHERIAKARAAAISKSLYPVFVLHLAAFLLPLPQAVLAGSPWVYVRGVAIVLAISYGLAAIFWLLGRMAAGAFAASPPAAAWISRVPVVGAWLTLRGAARFASVFSLFVRSGAGLFHGMELAASTCGNALLAAAAGRARETVKAGGELSTCFLPGAGIPARVADALRIGEESGRMDEELQKAAEELDAESAGFLEALVEWIPRFLYVAVALFVGWSIINAALGIGTAMGEALGYE